MVDTDEGWFGAPTGAWVTPGRYTVSLAARGRTVSQSVDVSGDSRVEMASGALQGRAESSARLAALQKSFNDGVELHKRMAAERERLEKALSTTPARRDSVAPLMAKVKQDMDSLGKRFAAGFGGPKFGFLDLDGSMQASSTSPTVAQLRTIEQLGGQLRTDLTALNALLAGTFAELQRRAEGAGVRLEGVVVP